MYRILGQFTQDLELGCYRYNHYMMSSRWIFSEISISTVKERGRSASSVILSFLTSSSFESFIRNC